MEQTLEENETTPDLQKATIDILTGVQTCSIPHQYSFGQANFGVGLTFQGIMFDQADIKWIHIFFSGV